MARVSEDILPEGFVPYMTLDRYQEIMRLPIAAFNGLNKPDEEPQYQCSEIWNQRERDYLALHLATAEEMREAELGYPLAPRYFEGVDYEFASPLILKHKHLVLVGTQKESDISIGVTLDHGVPTIIDPVIVTVATTVTDTGEIKVFYPDEAVEIHPSSITISAGVATIKIPRSRLVKPELNDNREDKLYYDNNDNFLETLDVKRVYYDTSDAAYSVWDYDSCTSLEESTQLAHIKILDNRLAIVGSLPATYSDGLFAYTQYTNCRFPNRIRLNYVAGRQKSMFTEIMTARLAHTNMPNKPCSCPTVHMYWQEDIMETETLTPYGNKRGAVNAWLADSRQKVGQGGKFPSMRDYTGR